ncbi:hypothetical protein NLI96_g7278 [Meripilus lineatus]|uniref:Uncharacterized protein n=1 Tax=Meripilus lineatus TaxID=2056292 RepID=A0AAD5UZI6_9APHY|nr:hypothetical protein NLI96_g7278 [Physisporinus lineatus]
MHSLTPPPTVRIAPDVTERRFSSSESDVKSLIDTISGAAQDAASRHAQQLRETLDMEREDQARQREQLDLERAQRDHERDAHHEEIVRMYEERLRKQEADCEEKMRLQREEFERVREELEAAREEMAKERELHSVEDAERRERDRAEDLQRAEDLRTQLDELTEKINQGQAEFIAERGIQEQRYQDKMARCDAKEAKLNEMLQLTAQIAATQDTERMRQEEERAAAAGRPSNDDVIAELKAEIGRLTEMLHNIVEDFRTDSARQHEDTINAVRATAQEQVPFNVRGYLDDFSRSLAAEVRLLLAEVGKLHEKKRGLQYQIGILMVEQSKYMPGGMLDPDWTGPDLAAACPPRAEAPPVHEATPPQAEEHVSAPARTGWRPVHRRSQRLRRSRAGPSAPPPAPPPPVPAHPPQQPRHLTVYPPPPSHRETQSWSRWEPDPNNLPTPPSRPVTLLSPEHERPGLFGPRSMSGSAHVHPREIPESVVLQLQPFYSVNDAIITTRFLSNSQQTSSVCQWLRTRPKRLLRQPPHSLAPPISTPSSSTLRLSDDLPPTSFSDPERPGLYYHLFEPPTSVSSTSPVFAISFLPGAPLVAESKTVLGWLPAQTFGGDGEAGLNDFRQNPSFLNILHEAIESGLNDGVDEVQKNGAIQTQQGWMHIHDERNVPALGRIGDPDDIIASVRVEEGKILPGTYQRMPSYRLCTSDGIMQLSEGLANRLMETLRKYAELETRA